MKGLSLNGGGIRGIITCIALEAFESVKFDVIAGNSTGSIISGLLALGYKPVEIKEIYKETSNKVFKKRLFSGFLRPKYSIEDLRKELFKRIGNIKLGDLETKVIIPSYDTIRGEPVIFKSYKEKHKNTLLVDAITGSCAAPTYFSCFEYKEKCLIDGGIYANNPSAILVREYERENWKGEIINVGTGKTYNSFKPINWGVVQWISSGKTNIVDVILDSSHDIIVEQCKGKFEYKNYDIEIPYIAMDDLEGIENLEIYGNMLKSKILEDVKGKH